MLGLIRLWPFCVIYSFRIKEGIIKYLNETKTSKICIFVSWSACLCTVVGYNTYNACFFHVNKPVTYRWLVFIPNICLPLTYVPFPWVSACNSNTFPCTWFQDFRHCTALNFTGRPQTTASKWLQLGISTDYLIWYCQVGTKCCIIIS